MDLKNLHKNHPWVYVVMTRRVSERFARALLDEVGEAMYIAVCSSNAMNEPDHISECHSNEVLARRDAIALMHVAMEKEGFAPMLQDDDAVHELITAAWDIWRTHPIQTLTSK